MITVSILGLDPYLVRQISKAMTPKLAELYEIKKDNIDFYAPECLFIHDGVEQNTWNVLVRVNAPLKVKALEHEASHIIYEFLKDACVHLAVEFYYYNQDSRYEFIREDHPRFMTEDNSVNIEDEDDYEDECDDPNCEHHHHDEEEPYLGNIFEDFEKKMNGDK